MVTANARPESSSLSARGDLGVKAGDAKSKIGEVAGEVTDEAKLSAATLASGANNKMWDFMGKQVGAGANLVGHVAASTGLIKTASLREMFRALARVSLSVTILKHRRLL